MPPAAPQMRTFVARLATFQQPHQVGRRRASSQSNRRKAGNAIQWPHKHPSPDELASAGFFYCPSADRADNVQCFNCNVKLDGWEPTDEPRREHLTHRSDCEWAIIQGAASLSDQDPRDPMSPDLVAARRATFDKAGGWVHHGKPGWVCTVEKMVNAGWVYDPSPECDDGVSCFYCTVGLDGWEPEDDPWAEHLRKTPDCLFFALVERHRSRADVNDVLHSQASKSGGVSLDPEQAEPDLDGDDNVAGMDDSVASMATTTSQSTIKGGKKKGARTKASAQGTKKTSQGRKPKAQRTSVAEPSVEHEARSSEVSAQLQEELENSMDLAGMETPPQPAPARSKRGVKRTSDGMRKTEESSALTLEFPVPPKAIPAAKTKRGGKAGKGSTRESRTEEVDASLIEYPWMESDALEIDAPPAKTRKAPARKGRRTKASSTRSSRTTVTASEPEEGPDEPMEDLVRDEMEIDAELARMGAEAQAAERLLAAQTQRDAMRVEQEKEDEFETSPSHAQKHSRQIYELEEGLREEIRALPPPGINMANLVATLSASPLPSPVQPESVETGVHPRAEPARHATSPNPTPSASGSDKENEPSSNPPPIPHAPARFSPSPMTKKTTRLALAPGTPNRARADPHSRASPSKHTALSRLRSSVPWRAVDLDALLASPAPTEGGGLSQRLVDVAGVLSSPEKGMTVEEWVLYHAERAEEALRRRGEELVGGFEREGMRAVACLEGMVVT